MKILALDGGGSSGTITTAFLRDLEAEIGPIWKKFDLIAGVSTGSIIGALLAIGMPAAEIHKLYINLVPEIFGKPRLLLTRLWAAKYDSTTLQQLVRAHLGYKYMKDCQTKFMASAIDISDSAGIKPKFWKSWKHETELADVVLASSAAPTYFDPHEFEGATYVDGGLAANNLSMCALAEAVKITGLNVNHYILNMGCSTMASLKKPAKIRGVGPWISKIFGLSLYAGCEIAEYQCHQMIGFNNHCVRPLVDLPLDSLDTEKMTCIGKQLWREHAGTLVEKLA